MSHKKLTAQYWDKLRNENIISFLLRRDRLALLRPLLDAETLKLEKLQKLNKRRALDFGPIIFLEDLQELLEGVKKDVDDFLGIEDIPEPKLLPYSMFSWSAGFAFMLTFLLGAALALLGFLVWHGYHAYWLMFFLGAGFLYLGYMVIDRVVFYGSRVASSYSYNSLTQTIIVPADLGSYGRRAELAYILAHEYAHHVQKIFGMGHDFSRRLNFFKEGFAIGVQAHIAKIYSVRENNGAFLFGTLDEMVGAMQGVYIWLTRQLEAPFIKRPKWAKTSRRPFEPMLGRESSVKTPSVHALGCVLFLLFESLYGVQIYGDILRGEFELKE